MAARAIPKRPAPQLPLTTPPNRTCQRPKKNAPRSTAATTPASASATCVRVPPRTHVPAMKRPASRRR